LQELQGSLFGLIDVALKQNLRLFSPSNLIELFFKQTSNLIGIIQNKFYFHVNNKINKSNSFFSSVINQFNLITLLT